MAEEKSNQLRIIGLAAVAGMLGCAAVAWKLWPSTPKQPQKAYVRCLSNDGFHRISYIDWGDPKSKKVAICWHGLTRNSRDFDFLGRHMAAKGWRVVAVDVVGRGDSDWVKTKTQYGYGLYMSDAATVLAHVMATMPLGAEIYWIGSSMGGLLGMMLASKPGFPCKKMVINDIGPLVPKAAISRISNYVMLHMNDRYRNLEECKKYFKSVYGERFGPTTDDAFWDHLAVHGFKKDSATNLYRHHYDPDISATFADAKDVKDVELWHAWDAINIPILVLHGESSDVLLPEVAKRMGASKEKDVQVIDIPKTAHLSPIYAVHEIEMVRKFLES
jgi:pimeloyl-ACP methyl ester carboxylesterase